MGKAIRVEISPGELIDKLTILEIKRERIHDPQKLAHVNAEYEELRRAWEVEAPEAPAVHALWARLHKTNDVRSQIKREINLGLGSALVEEKSYKPY